MISSQRLIISMLNELQKQRNEINELRQEIIKIKTSQETKEKEPISNHAITGVYYFKNLELFKDSVIDLVVENDLAKGEFYMSNVYNHLKKINSNIGIFDIQHFDCVGTPEQLNEYIERSKYARIQ